MRGAPASCFLFSEARQWGGGGRRGSSGGGGGGRRGSAWTTGRGPWRTYGTWSPVVADPEQLSSLCMRRIRNYTQNKEETAT